VLLVDDIVDTGLTLETLCNHLRNKSPARLHTCCLLRKLDRLETEQPIDYLGFDVPDRFIVGYGLDYAEKYRHLPFLSALSDPAD